MKTKGFFLAILLVFPTFFCAGNSTAESSKNEKSTDTLYFMGSGNWYLDKEKGKMMLLPTKGIELFD